jgi:hypothetical protein
MNDTIPDFIHRIDGHTDVLDRALVLWADRDDSKAQPEVRQAANTAMDTIDRMLGTLHAMRSRLVTEIRASDDATAVRVDAMLAAAKTASD